MGNGLVKKVTTLVKSSIFDVWYGSISLQFLKNLKLNRLINIEYQHKSNSVTEGYALFINMDHKHGLYSIFYAWIMKWYPNLRFISHTYTHIRFLARHTLSLKYVFYMLHDSLLWPDSFMVSRLLPSQLIFYAFRM